MSETLEGIVVDVSKMETTAPTREKSSAVGNAAAKHQFREVAKMIPHEEVSVSEMQQSFQPVTDCHGLNAAKMREALEQIHELLGIGGKPDTAMCIRYEAAYQIAEEALSEPPRNCDCHLAKNLIGAVTLYCSKNPDMPPMVEWNAIQ